MDEYDGGEVTNCNDRVKNRVLRAIIWLGLWNMHDWRIEDEYQTPLHYGTCFHTLKRCATCNMFVHDENEQYGP